MGRPFQLSYFHETTCIRSFCLRCKQHIFLFNFLDEALSLSLSLYLPVAPSLFRVIGLAFSVVFIFTPSPALPISLSLRLSLVFSIFLKHRKHLTIEFVAVPIFIFNIFPSRIEQAKVPAEVPQGISDSVLRKDIEHITKPCQKYFMRGFAPATTFAAMNTHT